MGYTISFFYLCIRILTIDFLYTHRNSSPNRRIKVWKEEIPKKPSCGETVGFWWDRGKFQKKFMVALEKRDRETLISIIKKYINPGTILVSDYWKYDILGELDYIHLKVS